MKKRIATAIFLTMLLTLAGGCTDSKDTATSSSTSQTEQQTTEPATEQETLVTTASSTEQLQAEITVLEPKPLHAKSIDKNPYMLCSQEIPIFIMIAIMMEHVILTKSPVKYLFQSFLQSNCK